MNHEDFNDSVEENEVENVTSETAEYDTQLHQQLAAQQEDYLRLRADYDNYIKRTQRDTEQRAVLEKETFIRDLLPILDDLERALAAESARASDSLYRGVTMTLQQMGQLLKQHGIEAVEDIGLPFDPHQHEAVMVRCDPNEEDGIVLAVIQRGYRHGDKVFRPARVVVNDLNRNPGGYDGH